MHATTPLISVVIPNYNHASFIEQRLRSVMGQSIDDVEIIFLDDASTDNSVALAKRHLASAARVQFQLEKTNSGKPCAQWARGAFVATGKYVWIAESDDFADERFLERLVSALEDDQTVGFAYCDTAVVDKDGIVVDRVSTTLNRVFSTDRWARAFKSEVFAEVCDYLLEACPIGNVSSVLFRRDALLSVLDRSTFYVGHGDWLVYCLLCLQYRASYVSSPLNFWRHHGGNLTLAQKAVDRLRERVQLRGDVLRYAAQIGRCTAPLRHAVRRSLVGELHALRQLHAALGRKERFELWNSLRAIQCRSFLPGALVG